MDRLDFLAMNILKGLMSRYGEAGYSDGSAIDEAYRLALNIIEYPITSSNKVYVEIAKCQMCLLENPNMEDCFNCFSGKISRNIT